MKKLINRGFITLFCFTLPIVLFAQQSNHTDLTLTEGIIRVTDVKQTSKPAVHPIAAKALQRGEARGEFKKATYTLAPNVKKMQGLKNSINMKTDGILEKSVFTPHPDTIYFDTDANSELIFRASPINNQQMLMTRPSFSSVFSDINIEQEEVRITLANTTDCAITNPTSSGRNDDYAINFRFDSVKYVIDSTKNGDKITVTLNGEIKLTNPRIEGKYTKNNGYRLVFKAAEQADLNVISTMKFSKEYKKLLWGTEVKITDLGKCDLGLFLLINANGEIKITAEIHQAFNMELGVHGSTCYYFPTSIRHIAEMEHYCDVNVDIYTKMKMFTGLRCTAKLKVKSYDVLDMYVDGGGEGTVETNNDKLIADIGLRTKSGGKIFSQKFTLFDKYYSLWKYQTPDFAGYQMTIHEACAYGDYVVGEIHKKGSSSTDPYVGALTVIVEHANNTNHQYNAQTNNNGLFVVKNIPLKNGDQVKIKLPGLNNPSSAIRTTIPFTEIGLFAADYYAGSAHGMVAGAKSEWYKIATQPTSSAHIQQATTIGSAQQTKNLNVASVSKSDILKRMNDFKNSVITYRGPIEFITRNNVARASIGTVTTRSSNRTIGAQADTKNTGSNKGTVNSPLGMFNISGLKFDPGQEVKARIELEGFMIESDWIETEGLMISNIEHENYRQSSGASGEIYAADRSFVIISPIRSESTPTGTMRIMKGVDVAHASLRSTTNIAEFPEAKKAVQFFDQTSTLQAVDGYRGTAIASTQSWSVAIPYTAPAEALNPAKNGKHPFELVSFRYNNVELGYQLFINECSGCKPGNAVNAVQKIQSQKPATLFQNIVIPQTAPVTQPRIGGGLSR